ncbi:methionine aminotransferase [Balneatrix alpica]|uniref:Methionine aminotransferase n=1 Tax=Balneatrix alpica TaxID=75684 RepID=A0ABV5ZCA1_9GAMM|nr:methionine aminotransferase [Balneatrix alpica]
MLPLTVNSKLPHVGTTIFSVIAEQIERHSALNLAQGAPDFPCDPTLVNLVTQAMQAGHNQYAPMAGVRALRQQVAEKVWRLYGRRYQEETEVTITASASEALYASISALVHPGDEVIFFEPAFDSYAPIVELQGGKAIGIPMQAPQFKIDWQRVSAAITPATRMIILNSPHNPTGQTLSEEDISELQRLVKHSKIVILSDEVYEHVVFDGALHHSMARYPDLAERSVIVSSFGKTFHVTGWRIGYCLAPQAIMAEVRKVHQFMMFSADTPMQHALASYLLDPEPYLGLSQFYQRKRDRLVSCLASSRLSLLPSRGSFFILADYSAISDEPEAHFVQRLIEQHRVAALPLSAFYRDGANPQNDHKMIRLSFARGDELLQQAAAALCQL